MHAVILVNLIVLSLPGLCVTLSCPFCDIHPDSPNQDISYCGGATVNCDDTEGCWVYQTEIYTLKGCKEIIPPGIGINPIPTDGKVECNKFWKGGVCVDKECVSCNKGATQHIFTLATLLVSGVTIWLL